MYSPPALWAEALQTQIPLDEVSVLSDGGASDGGAVTAACSWLRWCIRATPPARAVPPTAEPTRMLPAPAPEYPATAGVMYGSDRAAALACPMVLSAAEPAAASAAARALGSACWMDEVFAAVIAAVPFDAAATPAAPVADAAAADTGTVAGAGTPPTVDPVPLSTDFAATPFTEAPNMAYPISHPVHPPTRIPPAITATIFRGFKLPPDSPDPPSTCWSCTSPALPCTSHPSAPRLPRLARSSCPMGMSLRLLFTTSSPSAPSHRTPTAPASFRLSKCPSSLSLGTLGGLRILSSVRTLSPYSSHTSGASPRSRLPAPTPLLPRFPTPPPTPPTPPTPPPTPL
eukprot:Hpha_TRINITY_DN19580_c0_g1::TRINITY_DN19580_c0_g1_i1::g.33556::m.33556